MIAYDLGVINRCFFRQKSLFLSLLAGFLVFFECLYDYFKSDFRLLKVVESFAIYLFVIVFLEILRDQIFVF
jgi:hypothetical protein